MTARDTIAAALHRKCVKPDCAAPTDWDREDADAVITAIRAMPPKRQAELIGGITQTNAAGTVTRVVGLWQETPQ